MAPETRPRHQAHQLALKWQTKYRHQNPASQKYPNPPARIKSSLGVVGGRTNPAAGAGLSPKRLEVSALAPLQVGTEGRPVILLSGPVKTSLRDVCVGGVCERDRRHNHTITNTQTHIPGLISRKKRFYGLQTHEHISPNEHPVQTFLRVVNIKIPRFYGPEGVHPRAVG